MQRVPDYLNENFKNRNYLLIFPNRVEEGDYRKPVAYTHLDVYKRQVLKCALHLKAIPAQLKKLKSILF